MSKATHSRPSQLLNIKDKLAAYQFDAACTMFGIIVENALQETEEVGFGDSKRRVNKYKLTTIMADDFKFDVGAQDIETLKGAHDGAFYDEVS